MHLTDAQERILRALRDGPRQAQEVSQTVGVETSAAYRHLEALRARSLVETEDLIEGPGRPKKMYRLAAAGWETFPRDYALLLAALMQEITEDEGRDALLSHLRGIAEKLGGPLAAEADLDKRLRALLKVYNDLGFEADLKRDGRDVVLVQRNCPFLRTARSDPEALCSCLDEGIMRAAVPDALISLRETLAKGDYRCRHEIRLRSGATARSKA